MTSSTAAMPVDGRGAGCATAGGMSTLRRLLSDILQSLQPTATTTSSRGSTSSRRRKDAMFSPFPERTALDRFADQTVIDMYTNRYSTADIYERALEILLENDSSSARNSPADWCDDVIDRREFNDRYDSGLQRVEKDTTTGRRRPRCTASSAGMRSRSPGSDVESILDAVGDSTDTYFGDVTLRRVFSLDAEVLQYVRDTPEVEYDVVDESGSRVSLSSIDDCRQRGGRINEPDCEFSIKTMGRAGTGYSTAAGAMSRMWTLPLARKLTSAVGERLSRVLPGIRINRVIGDVPSPRRRTSTKDNVPQAAGDGMLTVETFQPITCESKNGPAPVTSSIDENAVHSFTDVTDDDVTSKAPASGTHKAPTSNRASFSIADSEESLSRVPSSECSFSTSSTAPIRPSRSVDKLKSQLDILEAGTTGEPELTSSSCCGDDDDVDANEVNSVDSDFVRAFSPAAAFDGVRLFTGNGEVCRAEKETGIEFDAVMTGTSGARKYDHFDDSHTIDKTELMKYVISGRSDSGVTQSTCPPSLESSKTAPGVGAGQASRVDSVVERCQLSDGVDQLLPLSSDERSSFRTERVLVGNERDAAAGNRSPRNRPPTSQILQRRRDSAPIFVDSRFAKIQTALRKSSADNCSPDASRKLPYNSAVDLHRMRLLRESCSTASRTSSCEVVIGDTDRDLVADFRSKSAAIARLTSCRRRRRPRRKSWCSASSASTTNDDDDDDENMDETGDEEDEPSGHHKTGYQLTKDIRCMRSSSTISVQSAAFGSETESACDAALDRQRDFLFDSLLVDRLRRMRTRRQFVADSCDQVQMTSSYCDDATSASAAGCDISDVEIVADRATTWPPPPMTSTSCSSDASSSSCSSDDVDVRVIDDDVDATASGVDRLRRRQRFPRNSIGDDMSFLSSLDDDIVDSEATGDEFEITTGGEIGVTDRRGPCRGDVATTSGPNDHRAFRSPQRVSSSSGGVVVAVPELVSVGRIATKVEVLTAPIAQTSVADAHRATTRRIAKSAIV